jgi:hypothetical protein
MADVPIHNDNAILNSLGEENTVLHTYLTSTPCGTYEQKIKSDLKLRCKKHEHRQDDQVDDYIDIIRPHLKSATTLILNTTSTPLIEGIKLYMLNDRCSEFVNFDHSIMEERSLRLLSRVPLA